MKNMEFASAHAGNVFKFVVKLTSVKSPGEFSDVVTAAKYVSTLSWFRRSSRHCRAIIKKTSSGNGKAMKAGLGKLGPTADRRAVSPAYAQSPVRTSFWLWRKIDIEIGGIVIFTEKVTTGT